MVTQLLLIDPRELESTPVTGPVRSPRRTPALTAPILASVSSSVARSQRGRVQSRNPVTVPALPTAAARGGHAAPPAEQGSWRLDDRTRELGRRGIEEARRALAAAVERVDAATTRTAA